MTGEVGLFCNHGEKKRAQDAGADLYQAEEDSEREHASKEQLTSWNGKDRENEDVEDIGEEEVPLVYRGDAHDNEGVHDVDVVIACLRPEGSMCRSRRKCVVGGKEEERDDEGGERDRTGNLH